MRDVKEPKIRRAEIMEAALLLFMEKGYLKTTTQDIIKKVGISRGLLYYHFKNKEDVLYCLVESYSEPMLHKIHKLSYANHMSAIEKINSFINITMISPELITNEMIELQKTVDLEQNQYLMDKFSHTMIDKMTSYFTIILEQGIAEKTFAVDYPSETAYILMTGFVFTANSLKNIDTSDGNEGITYLHAFREILARVLKVNLTLFE